jgi:hypothetical protein
MDYSKQIRTILLSICIQLCFNLYSQTEAVFNPFQDVFPVKIEKYKNTTIHFSLYGIENSTYSENKYFKFDSTGRLHELTVDYNWKKETWKYQYKKDEIIIKKYNAGNKFFAKEIIKKDTIKNKHFTFFTSIEYEKKIFFWKQILSKEYSFFNSGMIENCHEFWGKEFGSTHSYEYRNDRIFKITEYQDNNICYKEFFFEYEDEGYCNEEEHSYGNINKSKTRFYIEKVKPDNER